MADIDEEFGHAMTKGQTFTDFMKQEAIDAGNSISSIFKSLTNIQLGAPKDLAFDPLDPSNPMNVNPYKAPLPSADEIRREQRFYDLFENLRTKKRLLGEVNKEAAIQLELEKARALAEDANIDNAETRLAAYEKELRIVADLKEIRDLALDVGNAFGSAFEQFLVGELKARDAAKMFAIELQRLLIRQFITGPLAQNFAAGTSSFFTPKALGDVITPNALGNVYQQPTMINRFMVGESGPGEGLLPLSRDSRGRLAVSSTGGQVGPSVKVEAHFHGITRMDEFKAARGQLAAEFVRLGNRAVGRNR